MKTIKTSKKLPVALTQDELEQRGEQLTDSIKKATAMEGERKAENKKRKADIDMQNEITSALVEIVSSKQEPRDVECEKRMDFKGGTVTTVRLDTGEVVEARSMNMDERQEEMYEPKPERKPVKGKGDDPFGKDE